MSDAAAVRTDLDGGVLTVTLADVDNRNALSNRLVSGFVDALDRAERDDEVRVVVVTNDGPVFCAGADLSEKSSGGLAGATIDPAELFARIGTSPKPFVGRIAGHAVGGGVGLAAAMDISVAVEDAKFGFTEVRVGAAPAIISVICLPKMRAADAASAFLRGNRFLAPEAERLGLINDCVAPDLLDDAVDEIVGDLLEGAPGALAAAKQLLARVPSMNRDEAFAWTADLSASLFAGDEAQAGMTAFLERTPPPWSPRSDPESDPDD